MCLSTFARSRVTIKNRLVTGKVNSSFYFKVQCYLTRCVAWERRLRSVNYRPVNAGL